jgi:hypothetical protein
MKRELTNQELLDRYIHALKTMLPPGQAEDIAAEVKSNLESVAEDRAMELGRELRPSEMSAILKLRGHPVLVASRYRDQPGRGLISPLLFPFYWFTLRATLALWVTIRVILAVFAFQGTVPAQSILLLLGRGILLAGFFIPAGVTLLFATYEYLESKFRYSERWKPESLSPVPPPVPQPRHRSPLSHIAGGAALLIFYALALYSPWLFWVWGGRGVFSPSETLYAMRLPLWLLVFLWMSQSWLSHTRFAAAEWRRYLCDTLIVAGIAIAIFLVRTGDLLVEGPRWNPTESKSWATLNQMLSGTLLLACIVSGLVWVHELRRFAGRWGRNLPAAHSTS